jgi:hypothetical protein
VNDDEVLEGAAMDVEVVHRKEDSNIKMERSEQQLMDASAESDPSPNSGVGNIPQ